MAVFAEPLFDEQRLKGVGFWHLLQELLASLYLATCVYIVRLRRAFVCSCIVTVRQTVNAIVRQFT